VSAVLSPKARPVVARKSAAPSAQEVVDSHRSDDTGELFGITELCEQFSVSPRALRFYEDKDLLAPRRINGTRVYTRPSALRFQKSNTTWTCTARTAKAAHSK
jgi:hypothetical protein